MRALGIIPLSMFTSALPEATPSQLDVTQSHTIAIMPNNNDAGHTKCCNTKYLRP